MAYIQGEGRSQGSLFPVVLDDLVPADHMCRVVDAFVARLALSELGFERAQAAETGRPGYDPRDLLKLYLYGYLNQIRSSRRLEAECRRNVELMWLLGRLYPDHKSISEFRRLHSEAVAAAGAALIRFARNCGLIRGEWIAIDGSKFRAVASIDSTRDRLDLQRYLESIKKADEDQQAGIDASAVQAAVERLKQHPEPEAGYMLVRQTALPAYNVQIAVDAEHALIVAHEVVLDASDIRCLRPMAEATKRALELDTFNVVADAGYDAAYAREAFSLMDAEALTFLSHSLKAQGVDSTDLHPRKIRGLRTLCGRKLRMELARIGIRFPTSLSLRIGVRKQSRVSCRRIGQAQKPSQKHCSKLLCPGFRRPRPSCATTSAALFEVVKS